MKKVVKVLIVDDSVTFRSLVKKALEDEKDIEVIGSVMNGVKAMEFIENVGVPDIVSLDLEMPEMDGLQTLAAIQKHNLSHPNQNIACIMVSSLTQFGSENTIKALEAGAFDFITKPHEEDPTDNLKSLKSQLLTKIRCFNVQSKLSKEDLDDSNLSPAKPATKVKTRAVLIGCSTGGPKALGSLLPELCGLISLPILIVQHMPPHFTASLAKSLNKNCSHEISEAQGENIIEKNKVYIAPGGKHMVVRRNHNNQLITGLNDQAPENGCRPAVDVLFRSAAAQYSGDVVAVILTGMGTDGTRGLRPLHRAGAHIIVQDEASSVVWGMPGSAMKAGYVHEVLDLKKIATAIFENCT